MKLIFIGSGAFGVPCLEQVASSSHELLALFAQPDKPAGRGHKLTMPKTKPVAMSLGIPVHQPVKIRAPDAVASILSLKPEGIVVVAYGQIIPKSILAIPAYGIVNVHASLLPAYRGAAPIQWAIARGESETGVTTMLMDETLDTGPILLSRGHPIDGSDTTATLEPKLAAIGADLLVETLDRLERRTLTPTPQNDGQATLAPLLQKEDGLIQWRWSSRIIDCRIRAFQPWPVAYIEADGFTLKLLSAVPKDVLGVTGEPGTLMSFEDDGLVVACGEKTALLLRKVQAPGRAKMTAAAFARGRRLNPGDLLLGA